MRYSIVTFIESGQALVLFTLALCMLLLCVMSVVDVGFFLHNRAVTQQTADAAALAGAQELPNSPDNAKTVALSYVQKNGLDPGQTQIGFRCTSQVSTICLPGDGRYDTIVVTPKVNSPTYFGGALRMIGASGCWLQGCDVTASAAGCRGACGPIGTGPADIMTILDHSRSVSSSDLSRAQDAIDSMFTDFDSDYQQVGLAVTPPVNPNDRCDTVDNWSDPQVWKTADLSDDFQSSPHVLDQSSDAVHYADCVDTPSNWELSGSHTNLGTPLKAAADELAAKGRTETTWGIILLTDGAANVAPSGAVITNSTGERFCTQDSAVTRNSGDNNGYEMNASDGCRNGSGYATDKNSSSGTNTNCDSDQKDRHVFSGFGANSGIASDAAINGIEVRVDAWPNALGGKTATRALCIELSWDGGSHWTSAQVIDFQSADDTTYHIGGANDAWGHSWTQAQLSDSNLSLRITDVSNTKSTDFYLDAVSVNVTYSSGDAAQDNRGPCDWAMKQANAAKALGIEVYTIGWGVPGGDNCTNDDRNSPYYGMRATDFLKALATDSDHYFNQPKNADLTPVFSAIGSQLTTGARLVE
ncbi:MAG: pilus assembly protein TadG-related protein [Chloroflexota bacterium]